jgi:cytochrome c-type biogenesis protein CcmE
MTDVAVRARPFSSRKLRIGVALAAVAGALAWVAVSGLSKNLVYYKTPTEILQQGPSVFGQRIRLGGLVLPGTVRPSGSDVDFVVFDETTRMSVVATGGVPSLFRAGQGVVVEGFYGRDGLFHADTVLVKHSDDYRPPLPGQTPTSANLGG